MTSILKADTIQDSSGNNIINESSDTITIGASGDTTNIIGTLQNNGSAISIASLSTASGSAPSYSARAWVNFNGTGTVAIRANGNVSSITDYGTGSYQVNFSTAMADADFAAVASSVGIGSGAIVHTDGHNSSYVNIQTKNQSGSDTDSSNVNVVVFR